MREDALLTARQLFTMSGSTTRVVSMRSGLDEGKVALPSS